jgi:glycosyltransferase involved in cell wall biosynthesis
MQNPPILVVNEVAIILELARRLYWRRDPVLVGIDPVLRRPVNPRQYVAAIWKRLVFKRVDHFIHYFRDLGGLQRYFGIGPNRSSYVPFKANLSGHTEVQSNSDGKYVLCFGRSLRDYETFFKAMERLPYPGAIAQPNMDWLSRMGGRLGRSMSELPPNVEVLPDENTTEAVLRILKGARIVVLPILPSSIVASGIGTCLNSMLLGKCVIISQGPGTTDVFQSEILTVPPSDPAALGQMIVRAWEDNELRVKTAYAGLAFARAVGGTQQLYQRIIEQVVTFNVRRVRPELRSSRVHAA